MHFLKTKLSIIRIAGILIFLFLGSACNPNQESKPFSFNIPKGWPEPFYNFENNKVSIERFELGKTLFYDPQLSLTNNISCGTCHQPFAAFAQIDHDVSHGIFDRLGKRNSPSLFNLAWSSTFFWDGRVNHLEVQPLGPLQDPTEMGETLPNVISKLQADEKYHTMFSAAYGDTLIDSQRFLKALAMFMGMMVSDNAKYDQYKNGKANFTSEEERGYKIFQNNCAECHKEPLFTDFSFRSNGLNPTVTSKGTIDSGRGEFMPFDPMNMYKFKIPSLRNLKYTAPYMHDGRFINLKQVLNHYADINVNMENLDPILLNSIILNPQEQDDLLAFINTLNDPTFVSDPKFKQP
ncbi:MAG TPA: cytochrome-c peroxidase [Edaphocola sp.]|nr:cytochrome-c peroxidase [Edaphocola sp.]